MGPVSVVIRAPFVALRSDPEEHLETAYRLGLFPCLVLVGLIGLAVARTLPPSAARLLLGAGLVGFWLLNPATSRSIDLGHPEEAVAAALLIGAFAALRRDRVLLAALATGAALATKQWALLGLGPLILAAPRGTGLRFALVSAAVAAVLYLPMVVGDAGRFADALADSAADSAFTTPTNVWWPFTREDRTDPPEVLRVLVHPAVLAVAVLLSVAAARRGLRDLEILALLALIMLVRCLLDLYTFSYHHVPFLFAAALLAAMRPRLIAIPAVGALGVWATGELAVRVSRDALWVFYLAWAIPLAAWVAWCASPRRGTRSP